jgi:DNA-binding LacI/PurR family transcriptional regulator
MVFEHVDRSSSDAERHITMKDVARAVGVSQSTVSRILSGADVAIPIAAETRAKVAAAAQELGYRPNPLARALRGSRTMLLGVIVRDITDPFFGGAIEALSVEAAKFGYNVVLGLAHGSATEAIALAAVLEARHCDAMVVLGDMQDQPSLVDDLRAAHVPVVALWQGSQLRGIRSVNVDNHAGVLASVTHLRELGHQRIAFVSSNLLGDIRERQEAYFSLMSEVPPGYVQHVSNTPAGGRQALLDLYELADPPTAVIAATDLIALGLLHAAHAIGISVPRDLSIVGFDDISTAAFAVPALTTIRMPTTAMAKAAVRMAIDAMNAKAGARGDEVDLFQPELVIRASTAKPRTEVSSQLLKKRSKPPEMS